ncbi:hypothetical protein LOAG_08440 [Loa loa]|uniref:Uncharacterized protein n=1 Tax=Loa loa TaxID=7209 RepID=A0A1S0TTY0_LOALO|nr:hypothetical protein LOAG_08440 [Loa loa]EFO20051.1 hypothetical protein LOAG_08440 [Loa loa]
MFAAISFVIMIIRVSGKYNAMLNITITVAEVNSSSSNTKSEIYIKNFCSKLDMKQNRDIFDIIQNVISDITLRNDYNAENQIASVNLSLSTSTVECPYAHDNGDEMNREKEKAVQA